MFNPKNKKMKKMMLMGAVLAMSLMMAQGAQARVDSEVTSPVMGVDQDFQQAADAKKKEAKILAKADKAKNDVIKAEKALEKARDKAEKAKEKAEKALKAAEKAEKDLEKARKKAEELQEEANKILQGE